MSVEIPISPWLHGSTHRVAAIQPGDVDLPGLRLHLLTDDRRGQWTVRASGNWHRLSLPAGEAFLYGRRRQRRVCRDCSPFGRHRLLGFRG